MDFLTDFDGMAAGGRRAFPGADVLARPDLWVTDGVLKVAAGTTMVLLSY